VPLLVGLVHDPAGKIVLDPDACVRHALATCSRPSHAPARRARLSTRSTTRVCSLSGSAPATATASSPSAPLACAAHPSQPRATRRVRRWSPARPPGPRRQDQRDGPAARAVDGAHLRRPPRLPRHRPVRGEPAHARRKLRTPGTEQAAGPARWGPARLQGLAVCGRCGPRMTVGYHTAAAHWRPTARAWASRSRAARRRDY
jgi:hypothetical protein